MKHNKNVDMRDLSHRQPCDFTDPSHTEECCNRQTGAPRKYFTQEQRILNGPCRNWNNSVCQFSDFCKFAHVEICKFQKSCYYPDKCTFFHFDGSNQAFLGRKTYQPSFTLNLEEFPPLPQRNSRNRRM